MKDFKDIKELARFLVTNREPIDYWSLFQSVPKEKISELTAAIKQESAAYVATIKKRIEEDRRAFDRYMEEQKAHDVAIRREREEDRRKHEMFMAEQKAYIEAIRREREEDRRKHEMFMAEQNAYEALYFHNRFLVVGEA